MKHTSLDLLAATASVFLALTIVGGPASAAVLLETDFEGSSSLPAGWSQSQISGSATWKIQSGGGENGGSNPSSAHGGSRNATLFLANTGDNKARLISPVFWSEVYTNLSLTFWHTQEVWPNDQDELKVFYSTDGGTSWSQLAYYTASVAAWTQRTVPLPAPSANSRIAFEGNAKYGFGVCLDDVQVTGDATVSLPVVSVSATDPSASEEGADGGVWTVSRTGDTSGALTVGFSLSGTAAETDDYSISPAGSVSFASGEASVEVTLTTVDDTVFDEPAETAILTLASGAGYEIGTATDTITITDNDVSSVQVLVIGCSRDSGEQHRAPGSWENEKALSDPTSAPFSPTKIATELENILSGAGLGSVNVVVEDRYQYHADGIWGAYAYDLATWFHFPYPADVETTTRWPNLRGEGGTEWDYVILIGDPYNMEYTPGVYAHGVAKVAEEVAKGSAETVLLMPWPGAGSDSSVAHYKEVTYRVGRSSGLKVVPAGLAWQAAGSPAGGTHPSNDGAYIAAAAIYSRIWGQNAKASSYSYNDSLADTAFTTVNNNAGQPQYTGTFSFQNPYLMLNDKRRQVHYSERGTSTEQGFKTKLNTALARCNIAQISDYCDRYNSNTPEDDGLGWPTGREMPIAFNLGRSGLYAEDHKAYVINPSYWQLGFGFYYQGGWTTPDQFIGIMQKQDNDLANRMIVESPTSRNIPTRTLYASIHQVDPTQNPKRDGTHLSDPTDEAVGTFMYTMYSGRCPLDPEPATPDTTWKARKIGYETAWRMGRCQSRAPGFKVMPTAWNATNVTPSSSQTLSVRFILAPTSDVTVAVTTSDRFAGKVTPSALTFTPENYSDEQTVTVVGETGPAGSYAFDVILATSSSDPVYEGVSDSWDFMNTRSAGPAPADIQVLGNGFAITAGDTTPEAAMGTDFGLVPGGSVAQAFNIKNLSGSQSLTLTGSPRVDLSGGNAHFVLSQDAAAGTVSPLGSTDFQITYQPQSAGLHTALVSIASTDPSIPVYTFALAGTRLGQPIVESQEAVVNGITAATIGGVLTDGASADMWICWGDNDAGTSSTGDWDHVVSMGAVLEGATASSQVSSLETNTTYWFRCYAANSYGSDWSDLAVSFSGSPAGSISAVPVTSGLVAHWDAAGISGVSDGEQVTAWQNSANPGTYDLSHAGGSPKYRASVPELNGKPAVEFAAGGGDWFQFTEIGTIRTVFWVVHDSYATSGEQFLLGDDNSYHFHSSGDKMWGGYTSGNIKSGTTEVNGAAVDGTLVSRPTEPAIISLITTANVTASRVSRDRGYGRSWEGKIAEILIYDVPLSSEDEDAVGSYLAAKYGLSTSYPESQSAGALANTGASSITAGSAVLTALLDSGGTNFEVYVHFGTSDGGSNMEAWASSTYVGSWSDVSTSVGYSVGGLTGGQTYYYTFRASNDAGNVWASPSWTFTTLIGGPVTTNHSVPHAWLDSVATNVITDYEAEVMADPDGDGFSTWEEYWSGTDPHDGGSHLRIDAVSYSGTSVQLEWQHSGVDAAIPAITIEASTNLLTGPWVAAGQKNPVNGLNAWSETTTQKLFYRLAVTSAP